MPQNHTTEKSKRKERRGGATKAEVENIPNDPEFVPRQYQELFLDAMLYEKKRGVIVWHRRAGKEIICFNIMVFKAIFDRVGTYLYFFPTSRLGRRIIWDGANKDGKRFLDYAPKHLIKSLNSVEMKIEFTNGSIIQIMGTDSIINVGINPIGCVFSEYSLQDPKAWAYIRPILAENGGWAIFNGTPRGKNHFFDLYNMAKREEDWFCQKLTIEDTNVLSEKDIEKERREGMSEQMIQQEYYCSWDQGAEGAYYAKLLSECEMSKRIGKVPYDPMASVHTAWDLGVSDSTSIIFFQVTGNEIHIIDFYENSGEGLEHYVRVLQEKKYVYDRHFAPHDIKQRELSSGFSRLVAARKLGINFDVVDNIGILDGIELVRGIFPRLWFDEENCRYLIKCIENYHKNFNERLNVYSNTPVHDWSSHACDAFRYMAIAVKKLSTTVGMTEEQANDLETFYRKNYI